MSNRLIIASLLLLCSSAAVSDYLQRPQVQTYIDTLVNEYQFDQQFLTNIFRQAKPQQRVLEIIERPYEAQPWFIYRRQFLSEERIRRGVDFWQQHKTLLDDIARRYRVPVEVILAIVGIETHYGNITGNFPVVDTLITLGFDYPRRASFFRNELTELLLLSREENLRYRELKGSYAGAMGIGQFIPSSYRAYAVDFDGDRKRNLWTSLPDALASVANYLSRHGWVPDGAIASKVKLDGELHNLDVNTQLKPTLIAADLTKIGVTNLTPLSENKFALFSYQLSKDTAEYWVGYRNFYIITRYNRSRRYAMAVYQLSMALASRYNAVSGDS